LPTEELAKHGS
jgi:predicted RNA-binding protein with RPS1 domain